MENEKLRNYILTALFAAVMSILSQFTFPIGAVPVTLQSFVCALSGTVMGRRWGAAGIGLWLLLGALGVPVLTQGKAGLGILLSPVGGYYIGFILMAWICGFTAERNRVFWKQYLICGAGLVACYAMGTVYFMGYFQFALGKSMSLLTALTMTAFPFIPFDLIKIFFGASAGMKLRHVLSAAGSECGGQSRTHGRA